MHTVIQSKHRPFVTSLVHTIKTTHRFVMPRLPHLPLIYWYDIRATGNTEYGIVATPPWYAYRQRNTAQFIFSYEMLCCSLRAIFSRRFSTRNIVTSSKCTLYDIPGTSTRTCTTTRQYTPNAEYGTYRAKSLLFSPLSALITFDNKHDHHFQRICHWRPQDCREGGQSCQGCIQNVIQYLFPSIWETRPSPISASHRTTSSRHSTWQEYGWLR